MAEHGACLSRTRLALGDCKAKNGDQAGALAVFRAVLKDDPAEKTVLYRIARATH